MDEFLKAIVAKYASSDGDALRGLSAGGLWKDQAPTQVTGTYITLVVFPFVNSSVMGTTAETIETIAQFSCCNQAEGSDGLVIDAAKALRTLFQDAMLTMATHRILLAKFSGDNLLRDPASRGYMYIQKGRYLIGR